MKFLANENFPLPSIEILESNGFQILAVVEQMPGISDESVIDTAREGEYIILTFDKDYGELLFRYGMKDPVPIVFFRYKGNDPTFAGEFLLRVLNDGIMLDDHFTVVEESGVRQRKY